MFIGFYIKDEQENTIVDVYEVFDVYEVEDGILLETIISVN
jgi:hypothetical protein